MGGMNEAERLKDAGLDAKKATTTKLPVGQMFVATKGPTAHPRAGLPVDEALVQHIMANGMRATSGEPWRLIGRELVCDATRDGVTIEVEICNGSRRHKAALEAEKRLRKSAPRCAPLIWDKADPADLGRLFVEVSLIPSGDDAAFLMARLAANTEPGKLPDSVEVQAKTVIQLVKLGCEDFDAVRAVLPGNPTRKEVEALSRWEDLTVVARSHFVEVNAPRGILPAVLAAPRAEQCAAVDRLMAQGVRTVKGATRRANTEREKNGEPRPMRAMKPAKCLEVAKAALAVNVETLKAGEADFVRGVAFFARYVGGAKRPGTCPAPVLEILKRARGGKLAKRKAARGKAREARS